MLTPYEPMTLYSANRIGGAVRWQRTVLPAVSRHGGRAADVAVGGLSADDGCTVRVFEKHMPAGYVSPEIWNTLSEIGTQWSVQPGDVLVRGVAEESAQNGIAEVLRAHSEHSVVRSVYDNRRGLAAARHLRIEAR